MIKVIKHIIKAIKKDFSWTKRDILLTQICNHLKVVGGTAHRLHHAFVLPDKNLKKFSLKLFL